MEFIKHLEAPSGDIAGDDLDKLVNHLKRLEDFQEKLSSQSGLYLADQDGVLFGC